MSLEQIEKETEFIAERRRKFKELFEQDPDSFFHRDEVIMAALKSEKGVAICFGDCKRAEMEQALTRLTYRLFSMFTQMDMAAMLKSKSGIITPPESGKIVT